MVSWLRGPTALEQLGNRFDDLMQTAAVPLTACRTWLQTWVDTYQDYEPWIAVLDGPDGSLAGCAPLARRVRGGILDITNLGRGPTDYSFFTAVDQDAAERLADGIAASLQSLRRPWRLRVEQLPEGDPVAAGVADRLPVAAIETGDPSPIVVLNPDASPEEHMSQRMRRNMRTRTNRLAREGVVVRGVHETDPEAIGAYLPEIEAVWRERDRAVGRRVEADDRAGLGFFLASIDTLAAEGLVELTVLLFDDAVAAFSLCLLDGPAYRVWVARIAHEFAVYGPGALSTKFMLGQALARGCNQLDWMRGEEPYKLQTATTLVSHQHLLGWSSPIVQSLTERARQARTLLDRRRAERAGAAEPAAAPSG